MPQYTAECLDGLRRDEDYPSFIDVSPFDKAQTKVYANVQFFFSGGGLRIDYGVGRTLGGD